jgi:hypothetical protein
VTAADIIAAAVLFGPTTLATPALAWRIVAERRDAATTAAVLAEFRPGTDTDGTSAPPDGGEDQPVADDLAEVIPLRTRKAA